MVLCRLDEVEPPDRFGNDGCTKVCNPRLFRGASDIDYRNIARARTDRLYRPWPASLRQIDVGRDEMRLVIERLTDSLGLGGRYRATVGA